MLGLRDGEGKAPRPLLLGDRSSPGVACKEASDRKIRYAEILRAPNHARSPLCQEMEAVGG